MVKAAVFEQVCDFPVDQVAVKFIHNVITGRIEQHCKEKYNRQNLSHLSVDHQFPGKCTFLSVDIHYIHSGRQTCKVKRFFHFS